MDMDPPWLDRMVLFFGDGKLRDAEMGSQLTHLGHAANIVIMAPPKGFQPSLSLAWRIILLSK